MEDTVNLPGWVRWLTALSYALAACIALAAMAMGHAGAATPELPAALSLKNKQSPFKIRMAMGSSPFYLQEGMMSGQRAFWDNQWREDYDSGDAPNYVREKLFDEALPRFERYCRVLRELGFNSIVLGDVIHLVTFDGLDPKSPHAIYGPGHPMRMRHLYYRGYFKKLIGIARAHGLDFYVYSDEFVYTDELARWLGGEDKITPANPLLWRAHRAKYDELLTALPEISGVLLRVGEIYVYGGYKGRDIVGATGTRPDDYRRFVLDTWDIVRGKHKKNYIHRSWSLGMTGVHSDAAVYRRIWQGLPVDGLYVSVKHTKTDFWLYQQPNPTIGLGPQRQIVEHQARREYEGMGVFPAVFPAEMSGAMRRAADAGTVDGYWIWPAEGGWANGRGDGPQTGYPFLKGFAAWNEAAVWLLAALGHEPRADTKKLLREWSGAMYGAAAADALARVMELGMQVASRGMYIPEYASRNMWIPNPHVRWFKLENAGFDPYTQKLLPMNETNRLAADAAVAWRTAEEQRKIFAGVEGVVMDRELGRATAASLAHQESFYALMRDWRLRVLYEAQYRLCRTRVWPWRAPCPDAAELKKRFEAARKSLVKSRKSYDSSYGLYDTSKLLRF